MENLLGSIYSLFESFYGKPLSMYLWGYDCSTQAFDSEQRYNQFGMIAVVSAFIIPPLYYYVWNPVRHQQLKYWGLMIVTGLVNFAIAWHKLGQDFSNGLIGDCLRYNDQGSPVIDSINIIMFGIVDFIFVCMLFFATSMLGFKWGSKVVKHYPF